MLIDDQNPGQGGEGEDVTSQEDESQDDSSSSDPLDAIEDEEARAEAKRHRAIARRLEKKEKEDEEAPKGNFATKDDLKKIATNDAKKLVSDEVKQLWDELVAVPLGGFDPLDSESIAKNMQKRYALYILDNPDKAPDPSTDFTASPDVTANGGGNKAKPKVASRPLPGYKEPAQPSDWYPAS
jgi:hypothetical protein